MAVATESIRHHHNLWADAMIRLRRNRFAVAGAIIIFLITMLAFFVSVFSPYGYAQQDLNAILQGPSRSHPFGTDDLGRDVLTRLLYGARTSLAVGIFAQFIVLIIGLPIGAFSASASSRVDNFIMRFVDVIYAFPDILFIILIRSILGGSIYMMFLAIGLVAWVNVARLVRGQVLFQKQRDFVIAARAMGASENYITIKHLIPNSLGPVIVAVTFNIPRAIFAEAALSYIGIGIKPPTPSWGTMIRDGYDVIFAAPYLVLFPAVAIGMLMLSFTFLGDGLRDALDPRLRR
ncbi:MAG: ABC transporter permease [Dehalococcoidia bacterium]|nr:ABC transporter permease [Dehalococcoidia bacterium]